MDRDISGRICQYAPGRLTEYGQQLQPAHASAGHQPEEPEALTHSGPGRTPKAETAYLRFGEEAETGW